MLDLIIIFVSGTVQLAAVQLTSYIGHQGSDAVQMASGERYSGQQTLGWTPTFRGDDVEGFIIIGRM